MRMFKNGAYGETSGPGPEVVERILNRASSSDKAAGGSKLTTPFASIPKHHVLSQKEQQQLQRQLQQQRQQQQRYARNKINTRARGSGGLPKQLQYDYADLAELDEDQLLQLIYDEPELAAAARAAVENESPKTNKRRKSRYYRAADGTVTAGEYEHVTAMKEKGFPVIQWLILLVLLGMGVYRVRKSMARPNKSTKGDPKGGSKKGTEKSAGRKTGKQKGKRSSSKGKRMAGDSRPRSATPPPEDKPSAPGDLVSEPVAEMKAKGTSAAKKKQAAKKKSRKQKAGKKPVKEIEDQGYVSQESPDSVSTDGSSTTEMVPQSEEMEDRETLDLIRKLTNEDVSMQGVSSAAADDEGWQTVGGDASSVLKKRGRTNAKKTESSGEPINVALPQAVEKPVNGGNEAPEVSANNEAPASKAGKRGRKKAAVKKEAETEATVEETPTECVATQNKKLANGVRSKPEAADKTISADGMNRFEKTKQLVDEKIASIASPDKGGSELTEDSPMSDNKENEQAVVTDTPEVGAMATNEDAALALKLQLEEEKWAQESPQTVATEEVWEEVPKSRKKKKATA